MSAELRLCRVCGGENPDRAKFCLDCGAQLTLDLVEGLPQQATGGERRVVTVLFADLSGFTSFSEQTDVEDVRAIVHAAADRLGQIVTRYGGHVDKIIGDCVMAVWGAPAAHEDDADRAVRAALDMHDLVTDQSERFAGLPLSIGLNTGEVIWAPVGGQHTVLGDTVNTAARLQGAAGRGEIFVGEQTYLATKDFIEFETLEPITAKNKRDPVPAFRALAAKGVTRQRATTSLPVVGREAERMRLWELWERVRTENHPYGAVIIGSPGIGKSRLLQAVTQDIGADAVVLRGVCLPYGEGITYWPVIEIIRQAAGIQHDDDHDVVSEKLGALLESLGSDDVDELRTMAVTLANLVGEPVTPRGTYTATEISRGELHWGLRRILELASRASPIVLVIEDLHWAEPALLELVMAILEPGTQAPIFGLGTARPELADAHPDFLASRANHRVLSLGALDERASIELVASLVGEGDLDASTVRRLLDAAGGNPLFLEETIQAWVDAGAGPDELARMSVPDGLQAVIATRLDRLPATELGVLTHAAVIGDVFWPGGLAALDDSSETLDRALSSLVERDLIRSQATTSLTGQREYVFKHGIIRDVAYSRMPKSDRAVLHERAGHWIESIGPDEFAEIVAYHLEEACKLVGEVTRSAHTPPVLAAVRALTRAAEKSESREGTREAARFYDRALDLLGTQFPETSAELQLRRAYAGVSMGDFEGAYMKLSEASRAAAQIGRHDFRARALVYMAETGLVLGRVAEARQHLDDADEAAQLGDDVRNRIRVCFVRSNFHAAVDGLVDDADKDLRTARELAEESDDDDMLVGAELRIGILAYNVGRHSDAADAFRHAAKLARARGSLQNEATATAFLAHVAYHLGPRDEAERLARQAAEWLDRLNDRHLQAQALRLVGRLELERDDPAEAQRVLTQALAIMPPQGLMLASLQRLIAEARARQGRTIGARAAAAAAGEAASDAEPYATAYASIADGCAGVSEQAIDVVRRGFDRAVELLSQQSMATDLAESRVTYARSLTRFGEAEAAISQLDLARAVFVEMGATASVEHVDHLLAKTREGADLFGPLS